MSTQRSPRKKVYPKNLCEKWWCGGSRAWKPQGQTDQSVCGGRTEIGGKMMFRGFSIWIDQDDLDWRLGRMKIWRTVMNSTLDWICSIQTVPQYKCEVGSLVCGWWFACACSVVKLYLLLYDPMDCSPPGSSAHCILQARILWWVAISSSRGSSWPRDWTCISCTGRQILNHWATWLVTRYLFRTFLNTILGQKNKPYEPWLSVNLPSYLLL